MAENKVAKMGFFLTSVFNKALGPGLKFVFNFRLYDQDFFFLFFFSDK